MFKRVIVLILTVVVCTSCSGTVKGPITGNKYKVNVGGYKDKTEYDKQRTEAIKPAEEDCPIVDCPEPSKEVAPY